MMQLEDYKSLSEGDQALVEKHLRLAGEISKWLKIRRFLGDQIHQKKCKKRGQKFKITDPLVKSYYEKIVFTGRKSILSSDPFPCEFKGNLEDLLAIDLSDRNFPFQDVYYNLEDRTDDLKFCKFKPEEWFLSESQTMSNQDIIVMTKFRDDFLDFIKECIDTLAEGNHKAVACIKEYKRMQKAMIV
jgi:hypothetical protein